MRTMRITGVLLGCSWLVGFELAAPAAVLPEVSVEATDSYAAEFSAAGVWNPGVFTIRRTGELADGLMVRFSVGGTATPVLDYPDLANAVRIPAGAAAVTLTVDPIYSRTAEPTETVVLNLLDDSAYVVSGASNATVNIWKNDLSDPALPTVVVGSDGSGGEHLPGRVRQHGGL